MIELLNTLQATSSTNDKLKILKMNENEIIKTIISYTYDKVKFSYGVSLKVLDLTNTHNNTSNLDDMFKLLNKLNNRTVTGNSAIAKCNDMLISLDKDNSEIFKRIIDRDLKIGLNVKQFNKVFKNLILKPNYCRCAILDKKTAQKIEYPCFIQLKCDGTYREMCVSDGTVKFQTRSGEPYENPFLANITKDLPNGYYTGEFTVGKATEQTDRTKANGLLNSDNPPFENIYFTVWDYLTEDEYTCVTKSDYIDRFNRLNTVLNDLQSEYISVVPTYEVQNLSEALTKVSEWMAKDLEGGVLKSFKMNFKNGTSNQQLKIKLKVDVEMRCVGFIKGTQGSKYEDFNKVIVFENDDKTVKGQCSGMTDEMVEEVTKNADKYIGKILTVQFNDLQKAEGHDFYALAHPRFAEWRNDKSETDTLETVIKLRDMSKSL